MGVWMGSASKEPGDGPAQGDADTGAIKRALANRWTTRPRLWKGPWCAKSAVTTNLVTSRDAVEIVVSDTGHGVTQELKEKSSCPISDQEARTGLGLAIVNRIVEDHHGLDPRRGESPVGTRLSWNYRWRLSRKRTRRTACITFLSWTMNPASATRSGRAGG